MRRSCIYAPVSVTLGLLLGASTNLAATDAELRQLRGVDQLQAAFNRDAGVPRLVLLLSPT